MRLIRQRRAYPGRDCADRTARPVEMQFISRGTRPSRPSSNANPGVKPGLQGWWHHSVGYGETKPDSTRNQQSFPGGADSGGHDAPGVRDLLSNGGQPRGPVAKRQANFLPVAAKSNQIRYLAASQMTHALQPVKTSGAGHPCAADRSVQHTRYLHSTTICVCAAPQ